MAKLRASGDAVPSLRIGWRAKVLGWTARQFGTAAVASIIAGQEIADAPVDTRPHPIVRRAWTPTSAGTPARIRAIVGGEGAEGPVYSARLEGRHRSTAGNALRAAVLGANDGLLSNLSLIMGVAGASLGNREIIITGFAGLLAGASSMALGEWLSVQSSRELYEKQIAVEAEELRANPAEEAEELSLIYQAKGLSEPHAREVADRIIATEGSALDTLTREELGIDPLEMGGSAVQAASTSFLLFACGAIIPLLPFFVLSGQDAIIASLIASAFGLFGIGAGITLLTGRSVWASGTRQVIVASPPRRSRTRSVD
jgi:VIT1/CCC1 family predicted Fe2+/Mn2+ transporter